MDIQYSKLAVKTISVMDFQTKQRIKKGIEGIPLGDIKTLQGYQGLYRLRIGKWRIIFSYPDEDTILIEKIGTRGDVYKGGL